MGRRRYSFRRLIVAQLVEARRVTGGAPPRDERYSHVRLLT
jgi:hypothetical protein